MSERIPAPSIPRSLDSRYTGKPIIWISGGTQKIYLVNSTDHAITSVSSTAAGFVSYDDGVIPYSSDLKFEHTNIQRGEAVLIEKLDGYYDLDYSHQLSLVIDDERLGMFEVRTSPTKGKISTQTIYWEGNVPSEKIHIANL